MGPRWRPHGTATEGATDLELDEAHVARGSELATRFRRASTNLCRLRRRCGEAEARARWERLVNSHRQVVESPEIVAVAEGKKNLDPAIAIPSTLCSP